MSIKKFVSLITVTAIVISTFAISPFYTFAAPDYKTAVLHSFEGYSNIDDIWKPHSNGRITKVSMDTAEKHSGTASMKVMYDFTAGEGWAVADSAGSTDITAFPEEPVIETIGMWVCGDNSDTTIGIGVTDAAGDLVQFKNKAVAKMNFTGWRYIEFKMTDAIHPGTSNGKLDLPLKSVARISLSKSAAITGTIYVDDLSIKYTQKSKYPKFNDVALGFEYADAGSNWFMPTGQFPNDVTPKYSIGTNKDVVCGGEYAFKVNYNYAGSTFGFANVTSSQYEKKGTLLPYDETKKVKSFGIWIYGDGSGITVTLDTNDATGKNFKFGGANEGVRINWKGWKYVEYTLDSYYSPTSKTEITLPLRLYQFTVSDSTKSKTGTIYFDEISYNYEKDVLLNDFEVDSGLDVGLSTTEKHSGLSSAKVDYSFGTDTAKLVNVQNPAMYPLVKTEFPQVGMGFWVYGDGSGTKIQGKFKDSLDNHFTSKEEYINFTGWKFVEFGLDKDATHPASLEGILLTKAPGQQVNDGCIYIDDAKALYALDLKVTTDIKKGDLEVGQLNQVIVKFNNDMTPETVNTNTIIMEQNGKKMEGTTIEKVSANEYKLLLNAQLPFNTNCKLIISTGVADVYGQWITDEIEFKTAASKVEFAGDCTIDGAGVGTINNVMENIATHKGKAVVSKIKVGNYGEKSVDAKVVMAIYQVIDGKNKMFCMGSADAGIVDMDCEMNVNVTLNIPTTIQDGQTYCAYTYVWNANNGILESIVSPLVIGGAI